MDYSKVFDFYAALCLNCLVDLNQMQMHAHMTEYKQIGKL